MITYTRGRHKTVSVRVKDILDEVLWCMLVADDTNLLWE